MGNRGTETGMKLWNKVKLNAKGLVMADYWKSYNEMVPANQLIQSKKETYTVESYNGLIRHFLARFRRKSKCYTKSIQMMIFTLKLFFAKRNNILSILNY